MFYLDDGTIGGPEAIVLQHLWLIKREAFLLGLVLNRKKTELICEAPAGGDLLLFAPDLCQDKCRDAVLLGSPIGHSDSIDAAAIDKLKIMGSGLSFLRKHDALLLIHYALSILKILYILRTAPCFVSTYLDSFDSELCSILSSVINIYLDLQPAWSQAIGFSGLEIRSTAQLAPFSFLASAAVFFNPYPPYHSIIFPSYFRTLSYTFVDVGLEVLSRGHDHPPLPSLADRNQKACDFPHVQQNYFNLLDSTTDSKSHARLLAAATRDSGAWLNAIPVSLLGLWKYDDIIRVAVGLRLGIALSEPHQCRHCNGEVDESTTHGLSCKKIDTQLSRCASINSIVQRALATVQIPPILEFSGLNRSDGKCPGGVTITPWKAGRSLIWDVTCPDTFAISYRNLAIPEKLEWMLAWLKERRKLKYQQLTRSHHFILIAVKTSEAMGKEAINIFLKIWGLLGQQIRFRTSEPNSVCLLITFF